MFHKNSDLGPVCHPSPPGAPSQVTSTKTNPPIALASPVKVVLLAANRTEPESMTQQQHSQTLIRPSIPLVRMLWHSGMPYQRVPRRYRPFDLGPHLPDLPSQRPASSPELDWNIPDIGNQRPISSEGRHQMLRLKGPSGGSSEMQYCRPSSHRVAR